MKHSTSLDFGEVNSKDYGFHIRKIARLINAVYGKYLQHYHINPAQFSLLIHIADSQECTITAMAKQLCMHRTTLCRNVRPLLLLGLIELKNLDSKRDKFYQLTIDGQKVVSDASNSWQSIHNTLIEKVGLNHYHILFRELRHLTKVLTELLEDY